MFVAGAGAHGHTQKVVFVCAKCEFHCLNYKQAQWTRRFAAARDILVTFYCLAEAVRFNLDLK
jgi:hypothetical protein